MPRAVLRPGVAEVYGRDGGEVSPLFARGEYMKPLIQVGLGMAFVLACGSSEVAQSRQWPQSPSSSLTSAQCTYFNQGGRDQICHATGSDKHPYVLIRTSEAGCIDGHSNHPLDFIDVAGGNCNSAACLPVGAPCDATLGCCSGTCSSAACVCSAAGGSCATDADCCGGAACASGVCAASCWDCPVSTVAGTYHAGTASFAMPPGTTASVEAVCFSPFSDNGLALTEGPPGTFYAALPFCNGKEFFFLKNSNTCADELAFFGQVRLNDTTANIDAEGATASFFCGS